MPGPRLVTATAIAALAACASWACGGGTGDASAPTRMLPKDVDRIARPEPEDPIEACQYDIGTFPADAAPLVRALCVDVAQRNIPGAVLGVVREGKAPVFVAHGEACLDGVPTTEATLFRVGSITKALVALAVLDAGAPLDETVAVRLPALADLHPTVTLRHLMQHTSGLPDVAESETGELETLLADRAAWVPPGQVYAYSNSGIGLVARWLAHEGGSMASTIRDAIAAADLSEVWFDLSPPEGKPAACAHAAFGDTTIPTALGLDLPLADDAEHWSMAAGGAMASARGLIELARHLSTHPGLARDWVADGVGREWGYGIHRTRFGDSWVYGVRGDTGASSAEIRWDARGNVVVALSNTGGGLPTAMHAAIEHVFALDPSLRRRPEALPLDALPGRYRVGGWDEDLVIRPDGARLRIDMPATGSANVSLEADSMPNAWTMERPLAPPATVSFIENAGGIFIRGPGFVGVQVAMAPGG